MRTIDIKDYFGNHYQIIMGSKRTTLRLMLLDGDNVVIKGWEGYRLDLAFNQLSKQIPS